MSRTAALSGLAGIALLDVGWFWDPTPPIDWSAPHLASYFASHGNSQWLIAAVLQLLAVPLLWHFGAVVRDRLAAGGASPRTARIAGGTGKGFALTALVFGVCYSVFPFTALISDVGAPRPEIYRFWYSGTFAVYVPFSTAFVAVLIGAVCTGALRSRAVPLALGIAGIPLALLTLGTFFLPMAGITLWFAAASIALAATRGPSAGAAVPAPRAAVPTTV